MKNFLHEFKEFIVKGNLLEIASGLLLATAFKDLISSFSNTFILPLINKALNYAPKGSGDSAVKVAGIQFNYGAFIAELISFLITGIVLFLMVKLYNRLIPKKPKKPEPTELDILVEIRDLLNKKK
jgi:large conductance mechanosensitive channel